MYRYISRFSLTALFLFYSFFVAISQQWQWQNVKSGKFAAGYKTVIVKSYARPYSIMPVTPRILPLHIWYPSVNTGESKMKFLDLVKNEQHPSWGKHSASIILQNQLKQFMDTANLPAILKKLEAVTTGSILNALPAKGKFPVVLLGNGLSAPGFFYTLIAEYLTTHGFVVICFPSIPENENAKFEFNERGLLNQLEDMELVFEEIIKLQFADIDRLALAGWSVGGASQILFQMKHKIAKALISMDAASQYQYGKDLITHSVYYDSTEFKTPFLNLTAAGPAKYIVPRNNFFSDTLAVQKKQMTFPPLSHGNFLSFHQYAIWLEKPDEAVKRSYEEMCESMRLFLDEHVKK